MLERFCRKACIVLLVVSWVFAIIGISTQLLHDVLTFGFWSDHVLVGFPILSIYLAGLPISVVAFPVLWPKKED